MTHEEWRDAVGYEGLYQVSNLGRVRSVDRETVDALGHVRRYRGKVLVPSLKSAGYHSVELRARGVHKTVAVHRLVAEAFLEPDASRPYVDHIDGNRTNNMADNLRWCTQKENVWYAVEKGSITYDSFTGAARLTTERRGRDWCMTRILRDDGVIYESISSAAKDLGVTKSSVYNVLNGKNRTCRGHVLTAIGKTSIDETVDTEKMDDWYQMKHQAVAVIRDDGTEYKSLASAARAIGSCGSNITRAIKNGYSVKGHTFRFAKQA